MQKILIVDDDPANLTAIKEILKEHYKVITVPSGSMALEYLESNAPDLVLLDVLMPQMDGFEVLDKIKKMDAVKDIPIIFMTADNTAEMEVKCLEAGAVDYLAKPFIAKVMMTRIERVLEIEMMRKHLADSLAEKNQEISKIKSQSNKDVLTGLWNRIYTEDIINRRLLEEKVGTLFMMDLDNFKAINDNYGHKAGDETLQLFAETIMDIVDKEDIVCRLGGDEFLVFFAGDRAKCEVASVATVMIESICDALDDSKFDTNSSVSIGIAQAPLDGEDFAALYKAADKALYYVKQNGKNSFHFYSDKSELEHKRSESQIDLNYLRQVLSRIDGGKGTYLVDYDKFHLVYNFVRRIVERDKEDVQTVLFTLTPDNENEVDDKEIDNAIDVLEQAVYNSLRRVDVSTRYSSRQLIVILMDANTENGKMVAQRILDNFNRMFNGDIKASYDILEMQGKIVNRKI